MQCPIDNETLVMTSREGVEIDYCPKCRGVWLDRGELDKILERSATPSQPARGQQDARDHHVSGRREEAHRYDDDRNRRPKRRESFLSDLFDF